MKNTKDKKAREPARPESFFEIAEQASDKAPAISAVTKLPATLSGNKIVKHPHVNYTTSIMTVKANGTPYSEFKKAGWSDEQLVAEGYIEVKEATVSNEEFLRAIFGESYANALVTSFKDDPANINHDRIRKCWSIYPFCFRELIRDSNQFFCVSLFNNDENGQQKRQNALFRSQHCVVLDDVDEKLSLEQAKRLPNPSWKIKTSNNSQQWGYILGEPCRNRQHLDNLTDGLIASDLAPASKDPGMKGVTRLMRLPEGLNTKAKRVSENGGVPPRCVITAWNPELKYNLQQLAAPFKIHLDAPRNNSHNSKNLAVDTPGHPVFKILMYKPTKVKGKYEITCPWVKNHTDFIDNGAAIWTRVDGSIGFKCHHGHCESLHGSDVIAKLIKDFPEFEPEYSKFLSDIAFADVTLHSVVFDTLRPLKTKLRPVPEFPVEVLPQRLRAWIVDEAERMGAPVDFIAIGALVTLSSLLGKKFTIKPKQHDNWTVVPNLWGACVGRPSSMKSPSQKVATCFIREIETICREKHRLALHDYKIDVEVHETFTKSVKKEAQSLDNKEHIKEKITESQANAPVEPTLEQFIINSCTIEKLQMILEINSNGVLVLHDELSGFLSRLSKDDHSEDRTFYLTAFNGDESFAVDRVTRKSVYIEHCICSVLGGIQPSKLTQFMEGVSQGLGRNDDGLFQRFQLLVYPDFVMKDSVDCKPNDVARNLARTVYKKFHEFTLIPFSCLNFNGDAQLLFNEYHRAIRNKANRDANVGIEAHLGKYSSLMAALSLIFYLADSDHIETVNATSVNSAIKFCSYLEEHARRIFGQEDAVEYRAMILSEKLYKLKDGFTVRDVTRNNWTGLSDATKVIEAINVLIDHGYLAEVSAEITIGRPTKKYKINPILKK